MQEKRTATLLFKMGLDQKVDPASPQIGHVERVENYRFQKDGRVDAIGPYEDLDPGVINDVDNVVADNSRSSTIALSKTPTGSQITIIHNDRENTVFPTTKDIFWRSVAEDIERETEGIYKSHYSESSKFQLVAWLTEITGSNNWYNLKYYVKDKIKNEFSQGTIELKDSYHQDIITMCNSTKFAIVAVEYNNQTKGCSITLFSSGTNINDDLNEDNLKDRNGNDIFFLAKNATYPRHGNSKDASGKADNEDNELVLFDLYNKDNALYIAYIINDSTDNPKLRFHVFNNIYGSSRNSSIDQTKDLNAYNKISTKDQGHYKEIHNVHIFESPRFNFGSSVKVAVTGSNELEEAHVNDQGRQIDTARVDLTDRLLDKALDVPTGSVSFGQNEVPIERMVNFSVTSFPPEMDSNINFLVCGRGLDFPWPTDAVYVNDQFVYAHDAVGDGNAIRAQGSFHATRITGHFFASEVGQGGLINYSNPVFSVDDNVLNIAGVEEDIKLGPVGESSQFLMRALFTDIHGDLKDEFAEFATRNSVGVFQVQTKEKRSQEKIDGIDYYDFEGLYIFAADITFDTDPIEEPEDEDEAVEAYKLPEVTRQRLIYHNKDIKTEVTDITYCNANKTFYISLSDYGTNESKIYKLSKQEGRWVLEDTDFDANGQGSATSVCYAEKSEKRSILVSMRRSQQLDGTVDKTALWYLDINSEKHGPRRDKDGNIHDHSHYCFTVSPSKELIYARKLTATSRKTITDTTTVPMEREARNLDVSLRPDRDIPEDANRIYRSYINRRADNSEKFFRNFSGQRDAFTQIVPFNEAPQVGTVIFNDKNEFEFDDSSVADGAFEAYALAAAAGNLPLTLYNDDYIHSLSYKNDPARVEGSTVLNNKYVPFSGLTFLPDINFGTTTRNFMGAGARYALDRLYTKSGFIPTAFQTHRNFWEWSIARGDALSRNLLFNDIAIDNNSASVSAGRGGGEATAAVFGLCPYTLRVYYHFISTLKERGLRLTVQDKITAGGGEFVPDSIDISNDFGNFLEGSRFLPKAMCVDEVNHVLYIYGVEYTETVANNIDPVFLSNGALSNTRGNFGQQPQWFRRLCQNGFSVGNFTNFAPKTNSKGKIVAYNVNTESSNFGSRLPTLDVTGIGNNYSRMQYDPDIEKFFMRSFLIGTTDALNTDKSLLTNILIEQIDRTTKSVDFQYTPRSLLYTTSVRPDDSSTSTSFALGFKSKINSPDSGLISNKIVLPQRSDTDHSVFRNRIDLGMLQTSIIYQEETTTTTTHFDYKTINFFKYPDPLFKNLLQEFKPAVDFFEYIASTLNNIEPSSFSSPLTHFDTLPYDKERQLFDPDNFKRNRLYNSILHKNGSKYDILYNLRNYENGLTSINKVNTNATDTKTLARSFMLGNFSYKNNNYYLVASGEGVSGYFILNNNFELEAKFNYSFNIPNSKIVPDTKASIGERDGKSIICVATPRVVSANETSKSSITSNMRTTSLNNDPSDVRERFSPIARKVDNLYYISETPLLFFDGKEVLNHGFSLNPQLYLESDVESVNRVYRPVHGNVEYSSLFERKERYSYGYLAVHKFIDGKGNEHVSGVGLSNKVLEYPIGVNLEAYDSNGELIREVVNNRVRVELRGSPIEDKNYFTEIYRTEANGTLYRLITRFKDGDYRGSNSIVVYQDNLKDDKLLERNGKIFDPSYELSTENFQPDNVVGIEAFSTFALIWGLTHTPNAVYISRRFDRSLRKPLEFVSAFRQEFPERVIGVHRLDENAIIFTENKIFATNVNSFLRSTPREIQCKPENLPISNLVIVSTEEGIVWFAPNCGFFMLNRGGTVIYIGKQVENFNSRPVLRGVYATKNKEICFLVNDDFNCETGRVEADTSDDLGTVSSSFKKKEGGTVSRVGPLLPPPPSPSLTVSIVANPSTITNGGSTTLTWTSTNATTVTLNGESVALNGSKVVSPTENTNYNIVATNENGAATNDIATVTVRQPVVQPLTLNFTASETVIGEGQRTNLRFSTNGDSITIDQGVGSVGTAGVRSVFPTHQTWYTAIATRGSETLTKSVLIEVVRLSLTADRHFIHKPTHISQAAAGVVLTWSVDRGTPSYDTGEGTTKTSLSGMGDSGTIRADLRRTTTYRLMTTYSGKEFETSVTINALDFTLAFSGPLITKGNTTSVFWNADDRIKNLVLTHEDASTSIVPASNVHDLTSNTGRLSVVINLDTKFTFDGSLIDTVKVNGVDTPKTISFRVTDWVRVRGVYRGSSSAISTNVPNPRAFWTERYVEGLGSPLWRADSTRKRGMSGYNSKIVNNRGQIIQLSGVDDIIKSIHGTNRDGTMFVLVGTHVYAYNMITFDRDTNKEFNNLVSSGNTNPSNICVQRSILYVTDNGNAGNSFTKKIFAYNLLTKARDTSKDIVLSTDINDNKVFTGLEADTNTIWVVDRNANKILAYSTENKRRLTFSDLDVSIDSYTSFYGDICSDGLIMRAFNTRDKDIVAWNQP